MSIRVLCYHTVQDPENFEKQMLHLQKNYTVISLHDFQVFLAQGNSLPAKPVLLTFDDGDRSVFEKGLPVLKKYKFPAVLFIISELIGTNKPFWWDEIFRRTKNRGRVQSAKRVSNEERLQLLNELRADGPGDAYGQLSVDELKELERNGVAIANHSHSHPMLDKCTKGELETEMAMSKDFFEKNGLGGFSTFAYPNGNYDSQSEEVLVKQGVKYAFLFDHKINANKINPMRISRLSVNDHTPLWKFRFILSGWHSRVVPFVKYVHKLIS